MPWHLETIRATVLAPNIDGLGLLKWQELVQAPRVEHRNPAPFTFIESGFNEDYALAISREPERADLMAAARQLPTQLIPNTLGDLATFLPRFMEVIEKWVSHSEGVKRAALFCTIFQGDRSIEAALEVLLVKLPWLRHLPWFEKIPHEEIKDFLIQLNRPRKSKIDPSKSVNQFARWSVRTVTRMSTSPPFGTEPPLPFSLSPQAAAIQQARQTMPFYRAQAEIDINTAGGSDIPNAQIAQHFKEIASFMLELSESGGGPC
jgi:hypothetical protein